MTHITSIEILRVDLPPPVPRSDAIQAFVTQETPMVRLTMDDGSQGTGYSYTIGTGGSSVVALLRDHLAKRRGADAGSMRTHEAAPQRLCHPVPAQRTQRWGQRIDEGRARAEVAEDRREAGEMQGPRSFVVQRLGPAADRRAAARSG